MNAKKLLALLMSLVLLLGVLSGTALAADGEETAAPEATSAPAESASDNASAGSDAVSDAQAAAQEAYAKVVAQLDAASKKYDGSAVVATVNGTEVTWKLYYYLLGSLTSQYVNYSMAIPDFTTDMGDGTTLQDAMREAIEARMKYYTVAIAEAEERGLSDTVNAEVEEQWQSMIERFGGLDALMEANRDAQYPNLAYSNVNAVTSSFWRVSAARVALNRLTLAYTIPSSLYKKFGINNIRVNVTGQNVLNFYNPYPDKFMNPMAGTYGSYPNLRKWTVGVNLSF